METESIGGEAKHQLDTDELDYLLDTLNDNDHLPPIDMIEDVMNDHVNDVFRFLCEKKTRLNILRLSKNSFLL